ncbi:MAG: DUF2064 domain-containing protein [Candidatus Hodarchaeota archaeon]
MLSNKPSAIIIFTKVPKKGLVKTRLEHPNLESDFQANLQRAMIKDTILCLNQLKIDFIPMLVFYPEENYELLQRSVINQLEPICPDFISRIHFIPQKGTTIAERFANSFRAAFDEFQVSSALIIGSDTPHLQPYLLQESVRILQQEPNNAILGPSPRNGFYLLGIPHMIPYLDRILGASNELIGSMKVLAKSKLKVHILPELTDIDTISDLITVRTYIKLFSYQVALSLPYYIPQFTNQVLDSLSEKIWEEADQIHRSKANETWHYEGNAD